MPSIVWCARARYEVQGNVGETARLLEELSPEHTYCFLDLLAGGQVAINPAHVSAIERVGCDCGPGEMCSLSDCVARSSSGPRGASSSWKTKRTSGLAGA